MNTSGHGSVSSPPVCLPYSPEFGPVDPDAGLLSLDRLARSTAGKERIELAGIWQDLPKHPRILSIALWLISTAQVVLLLEVLERRTGLIARQRRPLPSRAKFADSVSARTEDGGKNHLC